MTLPKLLGRGPIAALSLTFCLAFAACGGDDDKKTSSTTTESTAAESTPATTTAPEAAEPSSDFVAQGNALCEAAKADIQALAEQEDVGGLVSRSNQLTEEIAALEPPAEQQEQFDSLVELARANDEEARRIVEDGGTLDDIAGLDSPEADAIAQELGLTACA